MIKEIIFNWCFLIVFGLFGCAFTYAFTSVLGQWFYDIFGKFTMWEWDDPESGPLITAWIIACVLAGILFAVLIFEYIVA